MTLSKFDIASSISSAVRGLEQVIQDGTEGIFFGRGASLLLTASFAEIVGFNDADARTRSEGPLSIEASSFTCKDVEPSGKGYFRGLPRGFEDDAEDTDISAVSDLRGRR